MRLRTLVLVVGAVVAAGCSPGSDAEQAEGFPRQPEGVPFPTESWPHGDWPEGVDRTAVEEAADAAFAGGGSLRVRAVLIVHGGKLVYERYSPNHADAPESVLPSYSLAKAVTSALVGVLVREGRLEVDAPAPVTAWRRGGDPRRKITLDDLLRMSSGLDWTDRPGAENPDLLALIAADDAAAFAADRKLVHPPGTRFVYSDADTIVIDRILADEVGSGDTFREFAEDELLSKIGIESVEMEFDDEGTWLGAWSADTTARNYAKLGLLYLRDGVWDGERILADGWVDYTRRPSSGNREYGAHWWLEPERPGAFYALGRDGQVIGVIPEHDLTFVLLSTDSQKSLAVSEAIVGAFEARR